MPLTGKGVNNASNPGSNNNTGGHKASVGLDHGNGMFGAPIKGTPGSEIYTNLSTRLAEIYKNKTDKTRNIFILDLDNETEKSLAYSCLIVAMTVEGDPDKGVTYHILILEGTGAELTPFMENIAGRQVKILRTPANALDEILLKAAGKVVASAFPNYKSFCIDACVIPRHFDINDDTQVYNLALNAGMACSTELETLDSSFKDINLSETNNRGNGLNIDISFNKQQLNDPSGQISRSDMIVGLNNKNINKQRTGSVNNGERENVISKVSAFTEIVWSPIGNNTFNQFDPNQPMSTQSFAPQLVITDINSNYSYTIGSVLLAIITTMTARDDSNWYQSFIPRLTSGKEIDLGDVGALNIEANITRDPKGYGERIDTKADSFKTKDLCNFLSAVVRPGLIISIDVPKAGAQTWFLSVFAAASSGNSSSAKSIILNAADQLTNGNFSKYFNQDMLMFDGNDNVIHNGFYKDNKGDIRDIRDIDYLAVCNLVGYRDPNLIREWSDTFLRTNIPLAIRLEAREKIIESLTGQSAVINGFSTRVTFTKDFLSALTKGIADVGIRISVSTPSNQGEMADQRGISNVDRSLNNPGFTFGSIPQSYGGNGGFVTQGNTPRWGN